MIRAALFLLLALSGAPAVAEEVVMGLSKSSVSISTDFDGSEILIFGAVKREVAIRPDPPLQVIVTVEGPKEPVTVWRKARRLGIWVNSEAVEVDSAPTFYAVATSAPLGEVLSEVEDLRHDISIPRAIRSVGAPMTILDSQSFTNALIRIRERAGLYHLDEGAVQLRESTLFDTAIAMPANITEGLYMTRVFLTRGGKVVASHSTEIDVRKVGLERWLYNLSRSQPLIYGLMSIAIAVLAGWGASAPLPPRRLCRLPVADHALEGQRRLRPHQQRQLLLLHRHRDHALADRGRDGHFRPRRAAVRGGGERLHLFRGGAVSRCPAPRDAGEPDRKQLGPLRGRRLPQRRRPRLHGGILRACLRRRGDAPAADPGPGPRGL